MKLNNRMKSSLIQTFIFNVLLLLAIILFIVFRVWPGFQEIQAKKQDLAVTYATFNTTVQDGMTIEDFQALSQESDFDEYQKQVIKNMNLGFYNRNFKNNTDNDFDTFIREREQGVIEERKASLLEERSGTVNTLLPIYVSTLAEDGITDFEFINYIESLLYSFNLISNDSIGVGELKRVEDENNENDLDSNIFYIPLSLELTGQKGDMIDFIYYLENVGSIDIKESSIDVYSDLAIGKTIVSNESLTDKNIYRNQFSDIASISMDRYIDESSDIVRGTFTDFIKTTQQKQRFSAELDLRFYVQGLPNYKIESYINDVISMHGNLLSESQKALKIAFDNDGENTSAKIKAQNSLRSIANILTLMSEDMKKLKIDLSKGTTDLRELYISSEQYRDKLVSIEQVMQESAVTLNSK